MVLVVFVFLREVRATLIPSVAVPLAIVGTFAVMYLFGYSLDNLSLMALTISTGFVVDDAIVVLENVMRHVEAGMTPYEAALLGAREIGFTVMSMSISLMAVFIPILLMSGLVGRLFHEFAVVLSSAIAVSMVVSLTTTPMLCARFLKPHDPGSHGVLYRMSERGFQSMNRGYRASLAWVLRHQALIFGLAILMLFVNVGLYIVVPKGFFPQQDTGRIGGHDYGRPGCLVRRHEDEDGRVHPYRSPGPGGAECAGLGGWRRRAEPGPHVRHPEAAEGAQGRQRRSGHQPPPPQALARAGRIALLPGRAGLADRRPHGQRSVPIHAFGREPRRVVCLGAQSCWTSCAPSNSSRT